MKAEFSPLVSICIPTYNGQDFLLEALDSAIVQTYKNLEIIISDDNSQDNTIDIVESFKSKTDIAMHIVHHQPKGIGANWNNCVRNANGDYIKFLFQDDVLEPNCITKMVSLAIAHPKVGLVYCKRAFLYETTTPQIASFIAYYGDLHRYWDGFIVIEGVLSGRTYLKDPQFLNSPKNKLGEPTNVLLRRDCFERVGFFSEELEQALDSDYWYRVMTAFDIGFIDEPLVKFRLHEAQASNVNKHRVIPDKDLVYKRYYDYLFTYLHPKNKLKLLKLYHPVFRTLVKIKRFFYVL